MENLRVITAVVVVLLLVGCATVDIASQGPFPESKRVALQTITSGSVQLPVSPTLGPITPADGWELAGMIGELDIDQNEDTDHIVLLIRKEPYSAIVVGRYEDNMTVFYALYKGEDFVLVEWAGSEGMSERVKPLEKT